MDYTGSSVNARMGGKDNPTNSFSFPDSGAITTSASRRVLFNNSVSEYTFSGLDDSLTYTIFLLNSHTGDGTNVEDLAWTFNDGKTLTIDGDGSDGSGIGEVVTTSAIATDGSGSITMTSNSANTQHINAFEFVAVPEPSLSALFFGIVAAGIVGRRRRG